MAIASPVIGAAPADTAGVDIVDVQPVNKRANRSLYRKREKIHPRKARGAFRRFKWFVMAVTLTIYYVTPWLRWDRGPNAPDQAVLVDLPGRRFYFFFIELWPQEVYYITGLLILAAMGLFLTATTVGRAWCGYSCPQTVWTDLFIAVERWVEGDRNARIRLDKAPMSVGKVAKRTVKHAIWLMIAVLTGGAWVFYFADAPTLLGQLAEFDAPLTAWLWIGILTAFTYVFGGFMREQVCTYMCPWPRIQAALGDEETLIVNYNRERGEPRGAHKRGDTWEGRGDCVDCNQCVAVCPMGIDIRDGLQLECISCALCIDACNDVMGKVGRPPNLISYGSIAAADAHARGGVHRFRWLRGRTIIYSAIMLAVGAIMVYALLTRAALDISVLHDRNPLFTPLSDGSVRNGYTIKVSNKTHDGRNFMLTIDGLPGAAAMRVGGDAGAATPHLPVGPDQVASFRIFVTVPPGTLQSESTPLTISVTDPETGVRAAEETVFRGPVR
jgi:cytochrome c oxidase accessory protein FixG